MAYQINVGGSDWSTIYVRDAETCKDLETDVLKWVKFSTMSWTKDNKGFFYSRFESPESKKKEDMAGAGTETEKLKNQRVYYHRVGTTQDEDVLVYEDTTQPDWMFGSEVSNDGKYVMIRVRKSTDRINLIYYVDLT